MFCFSSENNEIFYRFWTETILTSIWTVNISFWNPKESPIFVLTEARCYSKSLTNFISQKPENVTGKNHKARYVFVQYKGQLFRNGLTTPSELKGGTVIIRNTNLLISLFKSESQLGSRGLTGVYFWRHTLSRFSSAEKWKHIKALPTSIGFKSGFQWGSPSPTEGIFEALMQYYTFKL